MLYLIRERLMDIMAREDYRRGSNKSVIYSTQHYIMLRCNIIPQAKKSLNDGAQLIIRRFGVSVILIKFHVFSHNRECHHLTFVSNLPL